MSNPHFSRILSQYDETKRINRDRLVARHEEVSKYIPEYKEVEAQIRELSLTTTKNIIAGGDLSLLASLRSDIDALSIRKIRLLLDQGYPADYLEDLVDCPQCRDTAYIELERCPCFEQKLFDSLITQSSLVNRIYKENFSSFDLNLFSNELINPDTNTSDRNTMEYCLNTCYNFIDNFHLEHKNLLLTGQVGVGKTFLSNCIAYELIKQKKSVIYFSAIDFFDTTAREKFSTEKDEKLLLKQIYNCDLLIIDDLGTEMTNQYTESQLFACINERHNREKATLISTNLGLNEINDRYKDRIFSRFLGDYETLIITGEDLRFKKKY